MARLLPTALVVFLLVGSAAAFAVTERLKLERSPISATLVSKVLSPTCGCRSAAAEISFRLRAADTVTVAVVDDSGQVVKTLVAGVRLGAGRHSFHWNGQSETGARVRDGSYKPRVHLSHRTIVLPNPMLVDTDAPRATIVSAGPTTFSPDHDFVRDYVLVKYRLSEPARALLLVDGQVAVKVRLFDQSGKLQWYGRLAPPLPAGRYRVQLSAVDPAGNLARPTKPIIVRVRYIELASHLIRVRAGARFGVRVSTDAHVYRWSIGSRRGRVRRRFLVLTAGPAGRYRLLVSTHGHSDSAELVVSP